METSREEHAQQRERRVKRPWWDQWRTWGLKSERTVPACLTLQPITHKQPEGSFRSKI